MPIPRWKWGIEEKPKPQPVRRIPSWKRDSTRPPVKKEPIVVSRAVDQPTVTPYDYLKQHSKGITRHRLIQAEKVPGAKGKYAASMIAMRLAHGRLTPEQKREFGYRYTGWKEVPAVERKQYYGGKKHLKSLSPSEREQLIERYKKEEPAASLVFQELYKVLHGKSYEDPMEKQMWKGLTMSSGEMQKDFWKSVPAPLRWQMSGVHAFTSALAWPITLPQSLVKLATGGKTLILPDVGKELSKHKPSASPHGLISTGISEGIGALTGKGSDAWAKFQADPISGFSATIGELAGLKVGSIVVGGGLKTYRTAKIGLKYGKEDMLAYIRGEQVLVKSYPVAKGYPHIFRKGDRYASIWKYKGFGKKELVSLKKAAKLGKEGTMGVYYTPFGKRFEFRVTYESLKVKGLFRKIITKTYASTGKSHWVLEKGTTPKPVHIFTARDSGMVVKGFWKDTGAYQTLVPARTIHARPMISGRMHHAGYLGREGIKISVQDLSIGSLSSLGSALGYLSASALSNELRQKDRSLSVSKSAFKNIYAYATMPSMASVSLSDYAQIQKMKTASMSKSAMLSKAKTVFSTHGKWGRAFYDYSLMPKIPFLLPDDITRKKKKKEFDITPIDFTYHERVHPMRDIEKQLSIKSFDKSFGKDISKEIKKIMKKMKGV